MKRKYIDCQEVLIKTLRDPQEAFNYLNAAYEDKDKRVFLLALESVLESIKKYNIPK